MKARTDRRRDVRWLLNRPVKLRIVDNDRCLTGQMCNVSPSGILVDIDQSAVFLVRGQQLQVGIAWTSQQMLLHSNSLAAATVVRSSKIDGRQRVAIHFDHQLELARSA